MDPDQMERARYALMPALREVRNGKQPETNDQLGVHAKHEENCMFPFL
jgi:hypothetical protein